MWVLVIWMCIRELVQGKEYKQLAREASERASYRIFDSKYVQSCFGCHCEVVVGACSLSGSSTLCVGLF